MNPQVDIYFENETPWKAHILLLREIALSTGLEETLKWRNPCYTKDGRNIVLIHYFKEYAALLFFKGALMENKKGLLIRQSDEVQAARQMRFIDVKEIKRHIKDIRASILEAVAIEEAGLTIAKKKVEDYPVPEPLKVIFKQDKKFKDAFYKLTPGRQRAYLLHFGKAKQEQTVVRRIDAFRDRILRGKGLSDPD